MMQATYLILISGVGAAIGSVMRFGCLEIAPRLFGRWGDFMFLAINLVAASLAGIIYGFQPTLFDNTFFASGMIGGFSTFSAPIIDLADNIGHANQRWPAIGRMVVLIVGGLLCFQMGQWLVQ
ncbi:camphor resistance protein CrcB [Weissella viridescens]|uniref:Fluoride-specific ion channel n=1 Tax=Weissella viridescens TaxID=1629 RepID=A0A3P2RC67_WEIVI|nr:CrcB family protein [Weissella viridescens]RRG17376.1 camphor resistance protein CrcB [Weissella viridescens]